MTTPTVTEMPRHVEPTTRDCFIDGVPADVIQAAVRRPVSGNDQATTRSRS